MPELMLGVFQDILFWSGSLVAVWLSVELALAVRELRRNWQIDADRAARKALEEKLRAELLRAKGPIS